jgi:hypothetical protein
MPWRRIGEWRYSFTILDLGTRWRRPGLFTSGTHWAPEPDHISKIAQGDYKKATRVNHRTQNNTLDLTTALGGEQLLNSLVDSESLRAAANFSLPANYTDRVTAACRRS